jgi:hypothetical protein
MKTLIRPKAEQYKRWREMRKPKEAQSESKPN